MYLRQRSRKPEMPSFWSNQSRAGLILFAIAVITFIALRSILTAMLAKHHTAAQNRSMSNTPAESDIITQHELKKRKARVVEPVDQERILQMLHKARAVLYGASWCTFTVQQLREVGYSLGGADGTLLTPIASDAGSGATTVPTLKYIPCDIKGKLCSSAGVKGFPTWRIKGKMYPGFQSLENLQAILA